MTSQERALQPNAPPGGATGLSGTALREVPDQPPAGGGRSKAPIAIIGALLLVGLAAGAWWKTNQQTDGPVDQPVKVVDAGRAPELIIDAAVAVEPEELDAGAVAQVDAGTAPLAAVEDAGSGEVKPNPNPNPPAVRNGKLVLRVRPYADVFLDDKPLGETPLAPQSVPVGKHKLKLVNPTLGTVTLDVVIKPGENIVKHNFKE